MLSWSFRQALLAAVVVSAAISPGARSEDALRPAQQAIGRGLIFLDKDAAKWRQERGCSTCHHGTMTVWALSEARLRGFDVNAESLADNVQWTKERFVPNLTKPRDPRPGWSLVSVPAIYLGVMSQNLPVLSRDEINQMAGHLARHQEEDGTWLLPPPANGAPPTWESRETLAHWALLAWEPNSPADSSAAAELSAKREKSIAWLAENKSTDTNQAITLHLLLAVRRGKPADQVQAKIDELLKRQQADGGWSQAAELSSDAYATGQALYALSFAGAEGNRPDIQRALAFLVASQKDDGSWPMTSRNHPGVESTRDPIRNLVPITYFGSAWATLGLVRFVAPPPDTAAGKRKAFDEIQAFHGKFEVDEQAEGKPVVRVDLRYYDMEDAQLEKMVRLLQAFPKVATLQLKSAKITDAGIRNLENLPRLRSVALENAAITDAALVHLKALKELKEVSLKGTKVTDAGVQDLQKALPNLRIER